MSKKDLSYCAYVECKVTNCTKAMAGEDCYTLGLVSEYCPVEARLYEQWVKEEKELINRKCSNCGANIEVTEFDNGEVLIRRDCLCNKENKEN